MKDARTKRFIQILEPIRYCVLCCTATFSFLFGAWCWLGATPKLMSNVSIVSIVQPVFFIGVLCFGLFYWCIKIICK